MGDNMLVGELPTEMARLSLLKVLVMDENRCSGDFKNVVNSLSALDVLIMNDNNFTTVVDSLFLSNNINLNWTDFSNNLMTLSGDGTFPIHLLSMPQLQLLDLSHNELNGVLPTVIPGNSVLQYLALGRNQLNGNLPSSLTSLSNLVYFDVSSNGFGGQMDVVGKLTKLKTLFMSDNPFDAGQVPSVFTSLTMLTELSLRNTTLKGPLPDFIQSFTNLRLLDLGSNTLSGSVPPGYGDLSSLQYMLLNDNNGINGTLSPKFGIVQTLSGIFVDGTSLSGSVDFLCTLPNIQSNGPEDILFVDRGITCTCAACQFCTASQKSGCSRPQLDSLDLAWDDSFKRDSYKFVNGNKKY